MHIFFARVSDLFDKLADFVRTSHPHQCHGFVELLQCLCGYRPDEVKRCAGEEARWLWPVIIKMNKKIESPRHSNQATCHFYRFLQNVLFSIVICWSVSHHPIVDTTDVNACPMSKWPVHTQWRLRSYLSRRTRRKAPSWSQAPLACRLQRSSETL